MYCRTDVGGAYKWNAATSTWTPLQDWVAANQSGFYGVESLAIDPRATNKLYMLVGISYFDNGKTAILKSDDYGQTFTTIDVTTQFKAHGNGMGRSNGERLQVDPNLGSTLYAGTRYNGLWKSSNSGVTWSRLNGLNINTTPNGNGISFVLIDSASGTSGSASQTVYVGVSRPDSTGANFYKSTDAGNTFNPVAGGPSNYLPQRAVLNANGEIIMNYANGSGPGGTTAEPMGNGGIWKYNTVSGAWTNITPLGIAKAWGGISVDPNNPNRIIASTINNYQLQYGPATGGAYGDRIFLTTNGGASWTDVVARGFSLNTNGIPWILGQAIHWAGSIEFDPFNTSKVFVTSGNGVFSNDNIDVASAQWKFEVKGLEETVPTDIVSLPGGPLFTTVGDYDGFMFTDINQYGQRYTPTMGTTTGIAYAGNNPNILARVGSRIYYSTDQGANWTATPVINGSQGRITISADGSTILHSPNGTSATYYTRNFSSTWTLSSGLTVSNAMPVADMVNPDKIYVYNNGSGNFNVSNDGGASFAATVNIGSGGSKIIRTVPGKEGGVWVAMYGGGLKRSINSGTSFTTIAGVTSCSAIGLGKAAPGVAYFTLYMWGTVGGVTGLFRSADEGANWVRINNEATMFGGPGNAQFVAGDMNTFGVAYMSTVGRGVVAGQDLSALPASLVSINVQEAEQGGKHTALLTWKTLSESNASHFIIERSANAINWQNIGSQPTKAINGNNSTVLYYTYQDAITGVTGKLYYRLKMIDKNGSFVYGTLVSLNIGKAVEGLLVKMFPNPANARSTSSVKLTSDKDRRVILKILSANGAVINTRYAGLQSGSTNINLTEIKGLPSGPYTLQIISQGTLQSIGVVQFIVK